MRTKQTRTGPLRKWERDPEALDINRILKLLLRWDSETRLRMLDYVNDRMRGGKGEEGAEL
jgi:hypothetical protein